MKNSDRLSQNSESDVFFLKQHEGIWRLFDVLVDLLQLTFIVVPSMKKTEKKILLTLHN